jgi:hypothetical protein
MWLGRETGHNYAVAPHRLHMALLIDGYNLLHATGIVGRGIGPGTLERSRRALLNFLLASLPESELARTSVVFDAKDAPPGLPRRQLHGAIAVYYAAGYAEADDLLEELIRGDSAPRQLTVVSSDHRVQRAAKRRGARAVDSPVWYAEVLRQRRAEIAPSTEPLDKPAELTPDEVNRWLAEFGDIDVSQLEVQSTPEAPDSAVASSTASLPESPLPESPSPESPSPESLPSDDDKERDVRDLANPFPPGYAEDLLEDENES